MSHDDLARELKEAQRLLQRANLLWAAGLLRGPIRDPDDANEWIENVRKYVKRTVRTKRTAEGE